MRQGGQRNKIAKKTGLLIVIFKEHINFLAFCTVVLLHGQAGVLSLHDHSATTQIHGNISNTFYFYFLHFLLMKKIVREVCNISSFAIYSYLIFLPI